MAVKRKRSKGLATNIMCVLHHEGHAPGPWLARRFGVARNVMERTLDALDRTGYVTTNTVMSAGTYRLTSKGRTAAYRSKLCGNTPKRFAVTRAHSDAFYVPLRGARKRRRR